MSLIWLDVQCEATQQVEIDGKCIMTEVGALWILDVKWSGSSPYHLRVLPIPAIPDLGVDDTHHSLAEWLLFC